MKVVLADAAREDLRQIGEYIARENPARARSFLGELRRAAGELGRWPRRFPLVHSQRAVRKRTYGNYLILYRVDERRVIVLRFIHSARDYEALLGPEG